MKFTVLYIRNYKSLHTLFNFFGINFLITFSYLVVIGVTDSLQDLAVIVPVLVFPSSDMPEVGEVGRLDERRSPGFWNRSYPVFGADVVVAVEVLEELLTLSAGGPPLPCPPLPAEPNETEPNDDPLDPLPPVGTTDTSG